MTKANVKAASIMLNHPYGVIMGMAKYLQYNIKKKLEWGSNPHPLTQGKHAHNCATKPSEYLFHLFVKTT